MSEESPEPTNPFDFLLGDLMKTLTSSGINAQDFIGQFSLLPVAEAEYEANVDPLERVKYEQLFELAQLHVSNIDLLSGTAVSKAKLELVNPRKLVDVLTRAWSPYISTLSESLAVSSGTLPAVAGIDEDNPLSAIMSQLGSAMSPMISGAQIGSLLGHYCKEALRAYELPIPMADLSKVVVVPYSISKFAKEWNVDHDQLVLWLLVQELTVTLILGLEDFRDNFDLQIRLHLADMRADVHAMIEKIQGINPADPEALQAIFSDPTELIGNEMTEAQRINYANIEVTLIVLEAALNLVSRRVATALFGEYFLIDEASRRRQLDGPQAKIIMGRMFGIDISARVVELGSDLAAFVTDKRCEAELSLALNNHEHLPTPGELDDFETWLTRVKLQS